MSLALASAKSERLLNLLIMLLVQRHYVPKERIRSILYPGMGEEAFEKMFERDKDELRSLGVPIEVGSLDAFFEEPGYRIRRDLFELPEISFEPDEAAVVAVAAKVWEHARLAGATAGAIRKLRAAGVELDESGLEIAQAHLGAEEPAFAGLWEAVNERVPVSFDYRRPGADQQTRRLEPWGVVRHSGRWYVVGRDLDRDEERVFRSSRITGTVRRIGRPGAYVVPEGVDVRTVTRRLARADAPQEISVLARQGSCFGLRRTAVSVATEVTGPDGTQRWDRLRVTRGGDAVAELLSYGADLVVEGPAEVRAELVRRLRVAEAAPGDIPTASGGER